MSSGREEQHQRTVQPHAATAADKTAADLPPDVLADIVAATAAQLASPTPTDPQLQAALQDVARQYPGQPLTAEATGPALLAAVLTYQFPFLKSRSQLLQRAAEAVASSLLSDPAARHRVEYLWAQLQEGAE